MPNVVPPWSGQADRRGYAFITAIGVLAVLFILVFAVAGAVSGNRASLRDWRGRSKAMAVSQAAARWAARDGAASGAKRYDVDATPCYVEISEPALDDAAYAIGGLSRLPGDLRARVAFSPDKGANCWAWMINNQSNPRRAILLQRGDDSQP